MSALAVAPALLGLWRAERLGPAGIRRLQERRLRRLVAHAHAHVPFWRRRMDALGIAPGDIHTLDDLARLPVATRAELQEAAIADRTSGAFPAGRLIRLTTTGSTGRPLTVHLDDGEARRRQARFLRALLASGMRPGEPLLLIVRDRGRIPSWLRWRHVDPDLPVEALAAAVLATAPANIYGWVTPLRHLALHARERGLALPPARRIITTAEALDEPTRRLLEDVLGGRTSAIYGSTELGAVAWTCRAGGGLHVAEDSTLLEFLPVPGGAGTCRIVATTLCGLAAPLIRYDTGDLAAPAIRARCPCGSRLARIDRIEGRLVDSIRLAGGGLLSPFKLTQAVEGVAGLSRYQIVQEATDRILVRAEGGAGGKAAAEGEILARIRAVVAGPVDVRVRWEERLDPPPGAKFRVVESRVAGGQ